MIEDVRCSFRREYGARGAHFVDERAAAGFGEFDFGAHGQEVGEVRVGRAVDTGGMLAVETFGRGGEVVGGRQTPAPRIAVAHKRKTVKRRQVVVIVWRG